jgi:malonyl-ACP decarboxylase
VIATWLHMQTGRLHPSRNLENPLDPALNWVKNKSIDYPIENALTLSMGFGGINTALCWQRHH